MMRLNIAIAALAIAATAAAAQQPADALSVRRGQTELINRPEGQVQHCRGDNGFGRWHSCDESTNWN